MKTLIAAIAIAGATAVVRAQSPQFEAASIRRNLGAGSGGRQAGRGGPPLRFAPGRVWATTSTWRIILAAYGATPHQISDGPDWLDSDLYDIDARSVDCGADKGQLRLMLQTLQNGPAPMLKKEGTDLGKSPHPGGVAIVSRGPVLSLAEQISNPGVLPG